MARPIRFLFFVLLLLPNSSYAGWFGPSNYNECILDEMKGVTSNLAAYNIERACRARFPIQKPKDTRVPKQVLVKIDGRLGPSEYLGGLSGTLYNGNENWTITQVTIYCVSNADKTPRRYNVDTSISPLQTASVSVDTVAGEVSPKGFQWGIVGARGYQSR